MLKRKTNSSTNGERNWSELPEDILHLLSKKLHDISDFIRFRAVCKRWQLSAPVTDPPLQLPWLLENRQQEHHENGIMRFYCLSYGKVHTITCPDSRRAWLNGPGCRYLLASYFGSSDMYLLNPLTNDQVHVPFVNVPAFLPDYIGPDPIEGGDIVVILSAYGVVGVERNTFPNMMACWQPKADDCIFVEGVGYNANAYYMGQYFSNDKEIGIMNVIDIATKKFAYQVAPPDGTNHFPYRRTFMVESGGKILRLFMNYEANQLFFDVYCLYFSDGEKKPCWVKIIDIGDQMLFVQSYRGLSFCASNFAGFKGNCIYFIQDRRYLCKYDIGDNTTEVLPCPLDSVGNWFVPSLV